MKYFVHTIIFLIITFTVSMAEIVIVDDSGISSQLKKSLHNHEQNIDSLKILLKDKGYLDVEITQKPDTIFITAGVLYYLKYALIKNDSSVIKTDFPFTKNRFDNFVKELLDGYYKQGYMYPQIKIDSLIKNKNNLSAFINIITGPQMRIAQIIYRNLNRSNRELISRYLPVKTGDLIDNNILAGLEQKAKRIPFITFVPPIKVMPRAGYQSADLLFDFKEKKQFLFEGAGGIISDNSSSLSWNISMEFQNIFGKGRNLSLLSDHRIENRQVLKVNYNQPLFLTGLGHWGIDLATRDYRDQFYEFSISSNYITNLKNNMSLGFQSGWRSVEPNNNFPSYNVFEAGVLFANKSLDNKTNPSSGWDIDWKFSYLNRRYADDSRFDPDQKSYNETRADIFSSWYQAIYKNLVANISLRYLGFETSEDIPPIAELYYIGGPKTLRGFRNEQFTALRSGLLSLEPRWKFNNGNLFIFYDGAYISNRSLDNNNVINSDDYYQGYGFGISIIKNLQHIKLSLGWSNQLTFDNPYLSIDFSSEI